MARQQALTVVVVENGARNSEPYLGRPPEDGDGCLVFGQHAEESAFFLDLRLRECLDKLRAEGQRLDNAVLFWDNSSSDRDILRRTHLLARKLSPGSKLVYATYQPEALAAQVRLRQLAKIANEQLADSGVEICVWLEGSRDAKTVAPPLEAAWHRIQRYRYQKKTETQAAQRPTIPAICVSAELVESSDYQSTSATI